jgi:Do/DeqQ family serine protease
MKRYIPFVITGLLSSAFALGLFTLLYQPMVIQTSGEPQTVLTNYLPFSSTPTSAIPVGSPDLVRASNLAKMAVVFIEARPEATGTYFGRRYGQASTGSGVMISDNGYIATNHHVISGSDNIVVLLDDGREYEAKLIGSDASTDLALLKIDAKGLPHLTFGDSDSLMVGEWVLAIGNPFRLYSTVTAGIVSAKSRNINILDDSGIESFIQTDAAVNPGNSGGALVNTNGQLMGINTAIMTYSGQYEGFSFAVPSNLVKKVLEDIREFGSIRRGWLGVVIRPVDANLAKSSGLTEVSGVIIESVNPSSAADAAGLKAGDVITNIDGLKITSSPDFMGKIGEHRPGDVLNFKYVRDGKRQETKVKLSESRNSTSYEISLSGSPEDILTGIGMDVRDFNGIEKLRLPKSGVIVSDIRPGSKIAKANMEEQFIITKINGIAVDNVDGLKAEIKKADKSLYLQGYYEEYPGDYAYTLAISDFYNGDK